VIFGAVLLVLGRRKCCSQRVEELEGFVLRRDDGTVYPDVAQAQIGRKFQDSVFLLNGNPLRQLALSVRMYPPYPKVGNSSKATETVLKKGQGFTLRFP